MSSGRLVRSNKPPPTLGSQVAKMKVLLPLFQGLEIKPNMRQLVLSRAVLEAYKHGDTVRVPRGTIIREVSETQLKEECTVYSEAGVDDHERVQR